MLHSQKVNKDKFPYIVCPEIYATIDIKGKKFGD